jgi:hypothetical protein
MKTQQSAQELIDSCPKSNLGRMVVRIIPQPITAQEIINLPSYWSNAEIAQWYTKRLRGLKK